MVQFAILSILVLAPLYQSLWSGDVFIDKMEIGKLKESAHLLATASSPRMHDRLKNLKLLHSEIKDISDTLIFSMPQIPDTQLLVQRAIDASDAMYSVGETIEDLTFRARRTGEGRHKGLGLALSVYEWARITKRDCDSLWDTNHGSYFATLKPFKLKIVELENSAQLEKHFRDMQAIRGQCVSFEIAQLPTHLRVHFEKSLDDRIKDMCLEINGERIRELFAVLKMKVNEWEATANEVMKVVNGVVMRIRSLYSKPPLRLSGGMKKTYKDVAFVLSNIFHTGDFVAAKSRMENFVVNMTDFKALKTFTLTRLSEPFTAVAEKGSVNELAGRFKGLAELEQILELSHTKPAVLFGKVDAIMMKSVRWQGFMPMSYGEVDELISEMDKYAYSFDRDIPGNFFEKADAVVLGLAKELSFWENAFQNDSSLRQAEFSSIKEIVNSFYSDVQKFVAVSEKEILPSITRAREQVLRLSYKLDI